MDALASRPVLTTGLTIFTTAVLLRVLFPPPVPFPSDNSACLPSPRTSLLPHLSPAQAQALPYPPTTALPGARLVPTLHNTTTQAFLLGPPTGERVLLLAGISTPCIALSSLALALADRGHRVCLFDYHGRGYSDAPDPAVVDHDAALYIGQALCVLADVGWLGGGANLFHVLGYSFGGGLAVALASALPARVLHSITLVAPGGLMRRADHSWRTRLLYSRGWLPEAVLGWFVRGRFAPAVAGRKADDGAADAEVEQHQEERETEREEAVGRYGDPFETALVSPVALPGVTVAHVMAWQLVHHVGFVPAVMSAFRYGPIHERYAEWGRLGDMLAARREDQSLPGLVAGKMLLVLGETDSIVEKDFIVPETRRMLGDDGVEVVGMDAGHEVGITKGVEIADACIEFWNANSRVAATSSTSLEL